MKSFHLVFVIALLSSGVYAQGNNANAPGKQKTPGESAKQYAPGQKKQPEESAKEYSPGHTKDSKSKKDLDKLKNDGKGSKNKDNKPQQL